MMKNFNDRLEQGFADIFGSYERAKKEKINQAESARAAIENERLEGQPEEKTFRNRAVLPREGR